MNRLNEIEARANAATEGPWEVDPFIWKPGHPIPSSEWLGIEADGPVNGEVARIRLNDDAAVRDAEFIAHARADVPDMAAALRAVLELHKREEGPSGDYCDECFLKEWYWPCRTVETIRQHLGGDL